MLQRNTNVLASFFEFQFFYSENLVTIKIHFLEVEMGKFGKYATTIAFVMSFIGAISASETQQPEKTHILSSNAMITEDFSGIEGTIITKAILSWMSETRGDIMILPPEAKDGLYYDIIMKGDSPTMNIFEMDLAVDGKIPDPWSKGCRQTFYIIRITSSHPVVQEFEAQNRHVMAFTFTGCAYKFIAVVADRMSNEEVLYTTMLHELGHMWGLKDNQEGDASIMNGSWPGAKCITKRDLKEVYEIHGKKNREPLGAGCK